MVHPIISLKQVSFSYPDGVQVIEDVNLTINQGEFFGLIGPNGGGKSTLLKLILGLLKPSGGEIKVLNLPPQKARRYIGYVQQYVTFPRDFPISVENTVLMGRLGLTRTWLGYTNKDKDICQQVLQQLDIFELKNRSIGELSGGQMQRLLIARALACEPKILILDEPTASIDPQVEENIFEFLKLLNRSVTIVVVSHDVGFISQYVKRVGCINKSLICHTTEQLSGDFIKEVYRRPVKEIMHQK